MLFAFCFYVIRMASIKVADKVSEGICFDMLLGFGKKNIVNFCCKDNGVKKYAKKKNYSNGSSSFFIIEIA